jgi:hypothetical protein
MNNLPEKWMLKVTPENIEIINQWRKGKGRNENLGAYNRYSYVLYDGWGTNNEPNEPHMKVNYAEITFDQFKKFVLKEEVELDMLPESWCVLNDGSQSFMSTVIPYLNDILTKKGELTYDGKSQNYYYGIDTRRSSPPTLNYKPWGTILTLDQFIILTTQTMKTKITEVPIIYGSVYHLQAFLEDCVKLGYKKSKLCKIADNTICLKLNGNKDEDLLTEDGFKIITAVTYDSNYSGCIKKVKNFNLPQDWISALDFMKDNMEAWKEMNEKPKYKVGDYLYYHHCKVNESGGDVHKIIKIEDNRVWTDKSTGVICLIFQDTLEGGKESNSIRRATPEEIEQAQVKIFKMTSSSGDFELEVSKKGIYYRPENSWLNTKFQLLNNTAERNIDYANSSAPNSPEIGRYKMTLTKLDVGCKKDCLISEWQEVFKYYNLIKD